MYKEREAALRIARALDSGDTIEDLRETEDWKLVAEGCTCLYCCERRRCHYDTVR
jgi:hypothetical protein